MAIGCFLGYTILLNDHRTFLNIILYLLQCWRTFCFIPFTLFCSINRTKAILVVVDRCILFMLRSFSCCVVAIYYVALVLQFSSIFTTVNAQLFLIVNSKNCSFFYSFLIIFSKIPSLFGAGRCIIQIYVQVRLMFLMYDRAIYVCTISGMIQYALK